MMQWQPSKNISPTPFHFSFYHLKKSNNNNGSQDSGSWWWWVIGQFKPRRWTGHERWTGIEHSRWYWSSKDIIWTNYFAFIRGSMGIDGKWKACPSTPSWVHEQKKATKGKRWRARWCMHRHIYELSILRIRACAHKHAQMINRLENYKPACNVTQKH